MTTNVKNCTRDSMTNVHPLHNCFTMGKYKLKILFNGWPSSFTEKVKHRSDFWYHKYWWETIVHSILDLHKYCTGIRYGIVVLVSANVTCCMSHKAHKVRTIRYHTSQKDSLRAPLHITITVSYKIFFRMHRLSGLRCYFWILLRLGRLN